ncbi:MAG: hypothetical protein LBE65_05535 [Synergistaceae bacterium]|jgi:hypothetical protein|nr:hypothetical protein [Synergistaceae bacterium]
MDADLGTGVFMIVKGYIDARDERGRPLYGSVLGVVSRREVKYLNVMFSGDESLKTVEWRDLLPALRDKHPKSGRDPGILHNEGVLFDYLRNETVLNAVAKNRNIKQAEQAISRYCAESLHLKAVSLMECFDATEEDIGFFETEGGPAGPSSTGGGPEEPAEETAESESAQDAEQGDETPSAENIVIRCEPILDPVNGIAANELKMGEAVLARLPRDSALFGLLSNNIANFDGIITSTVTGIFLNEFGTSNISLSLSDGVTGLMKLSGRVKLKIVPKQQDEPKKNTARVPVKFLYGFWFGMAAVIIFILATAVVSYILR